MIYITGDTHGLKDIQKFDSPYFINTINKKNNYVIITGDMGATWNQETMQKCIDYYKKFDCTFLFVDGNNENFDILNKLPVTTFKGGKVHKISNNIIHLMRGQIFTIENKTFLAFGGADSWDRCREFVFPEDRDNYYVGKGRRTNHINWWKEERPTKEEFNEAIQNLKKYDNKVDVILTHETTTKNIDNYFSWSQAHQTSKMLDYIFKKTDFKLWCFGHHHHDIKVSKVERCMFNEFIKVDELTKYKSEYDSLDVSLEDLEKNPTNDNFEF